MATKQRIPNPTDAITSGVNAFDDLADAIANPQPGRPLRNAIGISGRGFCDAVGAIPESVRIGLGIPLWTPSLLCKPYWDKNGYSPPAESGSFSGGQCAGVAYRITGTLTTTRASCNGSNPITTTASDAPVVTRGPISIRRDLDVPKTCTPPRDTTVRWVVDGFTAGGSPETISVVGRSTSQGAFTAASATFTVERVDLAPDGCGDPEGGFQPGPAPPPTPPPFAPGFEPGVDPDGQPYFYVPDIPSPIPGGPDTPVPPIEPGGDGGSAGGPSEPPAGTDGGEGDAPGGEEPFEDPPPGERWVGCCITLIEEPTAVGVVPSSGDEKIYTTVYGNMRLVFDSLNGSGYDTPIQIRARTTCVWEPVRGLEPTGVRINLNPGFRYRLTKYSVPVEN